MDDDDKEYGDEQFIYAMVLMEEMEAKELEAKEREAQNEDKQEGDEV